LSGYVNLGEQVEKDFHRTLLKASLRRWKSRLPGNSRHERLLPFEEVHRSGAATSRYALELRRGYRRPLVRQSRSLRLPTPMPTPGKNARKSQETIPYLPGKSRL
jgi:hypothetical protein